MRGPGDRERGKNAYGDALPEGADGATPGKRTLVDELVEELRSRWKLRRKPAVTLGARPGKADGLMSGGDVFLAEAAVADPLRARYLIAHELAHVAQAQLPHDGAATLADAEAEARAAGEAFAAGTIPAAPRVPLSQGVDAADDPAGEVESVPGGVKLQEGNSLLIDVAWMKSDPDYKEQGGRVFIPNRIKQIHRAWKPVIWWMTEEQIARLPPDIARPDLSKKVFTMYASNWLLEYYGLPDDTEVGWVTYSDGGTAQCFSTKGLEQIAAANGAVTVSLSGALLSKSYRLLESQYGETVADDLKNQIEPIPATISPSQGAVVIPNSRSMMEHYFNPDGKAKWARGLARAKKGGGELFVGGGSGAEGAGAGTGAGTGASGPGPAGKEPKDGQKTTVTGEGGPTGSQDRPGAAKSVDASGARIPGTSVTKGVGFSNGLGEAERQEIVDYLEKIGRLGKKDGPDKLEEKLYGHEEIMLLRRLDKHPLKDRILEQLKSPGAKPAPPATPDATAPAPAAPAPASKDPFAELLDALNQGDREATAETLGEKGEGDKDGHRSGSWWGMAEADRVEKKRFYPRLPNGEIRHNGSHLWAGKEVGFWFQTSEKRLFLETTWFSTPQDRPRQHLAEGFTTDWPHHDQEPWKTKFESTGIYDIHAYVDMTLYEPGWVKLQVEVKTEDARLDELEKRSFDELGEVKSTTEKFEETRHGDEKYRVGEKHEGKLKDGALRRTITEKIASFEGDREKIRKLRETYEKKGGDEAAEIVAYCDDALRRLDERETKLTTEAKDGWQYFELRGAFLSEQPGIEDATLELVGLAKKVGSSILVQIHDYSHVWDAADSAFVGKKEKLFVRMDTGLNDARPVSTFDEALKSTFEVMVKEYPAGRLSIVANRLENDTLGPTKDLVGYQLHTGTLWKDIKKKAYHPVVQVLANAAAVAVAVFSGGTFGIVAMGLITAYNAADTVSNLESMQARGTATTIDEAGAVATIGLDLLPFLASAKCVGKIGKTAMYALDGMQVGANMTVLTDRGIRELGEYRADMIGQLADLHAQIEDLERGTNKSDPKLTELRKTYDERVVKLREAGQAKVKELAAAGAIMLMAPVAFNHMAAARKIAAAEFDDAAAKGLEKVTVVHEKDAPLRFDAETGQFKGDRTKTSSEDTVALLEVAEKNHAKQVDELAVALGTTPSKVRFSRGGGDVTVTQKDGVYHVTMSEGRWFSKSIPEVKAKASALQAKASAKPDAEQPAFKYASEDPAELANLRVKYPKTSTHPDETIVYRWADRTDGMGGVNGTTYWQTKQPNMDYPGKHLATSTVGELRATGEVRLDEGATGQGGDLGDSLIVIHNPGVTKAPGTIRLDKIQGYTNSNQPVYQKDDPDYVAPTERWKDRDGKWHFPEEEVPDVNPGTTKRFTAKVADLVVKDHLAVGREIDGRSEADEILSALAAGDHMATTRLGLDPLPQAFDPRSIEWGLGGTASGKLVIIRGGTAEVRWKEFPELVPLGHTHPYAPSKALGGGKNDPVPIDDLAAGGALEADRRRLFPSASDVAFVVREGVNSHVVFTPYVHHGGKRVGNPVDGQDLPVVRFELRQPKLAGVYESTEIPVHEVEVVALAGKDTLWTGKVYSVHARGEGSHVAFDKPPTWLKPVPNGQAPPAPRTTDAPMRAPRTEREALAYEDYQTLMRSDEDYTGKFHDEAWYERYEAGWTYDLKNRVWIKPDGAKAKAVKVFDGDAPDGKPWDGKSVYDYLAGNEATSTFKPFVDTVINHKITVGGTVVTKEHVIAEIDKLRPLGRDEDFIRHEVKLVYRKPLLDTMLAAGTPAERVVKMREITATLASSDKGAVFEDFVKATQARNAESHVLVSQDKMAKHPTTPVALQKDRYLDMFEDGTITEAKAGDGAPDGHELSQLEDNLKLLRANAFVETSTVAARVERVLYVYRSVDGARRRVALMRDVLSDKQLSGRFMFEVWTPAGERRIINSIESLEAETWLVAKPGTK